MSAHMQEIPDHILTEQELAELEGRDAEQAFLESMDLGPVPRGNPGELDAYISRWIRKVAEIDAEKEQNNAAAAAEISAIQAWQIARNAPLNRQRGWIEAHLRDVTQHYNFFGKKSRELAAGSFGWRLKRASVLILNMDAAVKFAEDHGLPVKISKTVGKRPLVAYVEDNDGEEPEGCDYIPAEDRFFVRPNGKDGAA